MGPRPQPFVQECYLTHTFKSLHSFPSEQGQLPGTVALFPSCRHHQVNAIAVVDTPYSMTYFRAPISSIVYRV